MVEKNNLLFEEYKEEFGRRDEWSYPKGFMYGGMAGSGSGSMISIARQFFLAAEVLLKNVNDNNVADYELSNPIFYLYRHSIELYLKAIIQKENNSSCKKIHKLNDLLESIKDMPVNIKKLINEFNTMDERSTFFRYENADDFKYDEMYCSAIKLENEMETFKKYAEQRLGRI